MKINKKVIRNNIKHNNNTILGDPEELQNPTGAKVRITDINL